jgi:protocatechuate 3,4-dioxygenase beta subunit
MSNKTSTLLLAVSIAFAQRPPQSPPQQSEQPGTATMAGRVTDGATGEPVRRAVVTATTEGNNGRSRRAMTGDDGSFIIRDAAKGKYWITAEKAGFVRGAYRGKTASSWGDAIDLAGDENRTGLDVTMQKQAVITGRIVDEAGEPVEHASVQAMPVRTARRGGSYSTMSNDKGEFRIAKLPPGAYRILASRLASRDETLTEKVEGRVTAEAPTYFPGTTDVNAAAVIRVTPGDERGGAEVRIQRSTVVNVRGRVTGEGVGDRSARLSLISAAQASSFGFRGPGGGGAGIGPDGSFTFRNVRPGEYQIVVNQFDRGGPKVTGRTSITVGQTDVNGVTVTALAPLKVDGRLRADGEPPFSFNKPRVSLGSDQGFGGPGSRAEVTEGNLFSINGVSRDRLTLNVEAGDGIIVKQIYAAGQPLQGLDIDFATTTGPLEVVLSNRPAKITGTIEGQQGETPRTTIYAVLEDQPLRFDGWRRKRTTLASGTTAFTLSSLRPGTYRVAAFEETESSDATTDAAFWERFRDRTATVKVAENETGQVKIRLITAKEIDEN